MCKSSESLFSISNGAMGQRANFEENYTGKHSKEVILLEFTIQTRQK
jgi:trehalose/maltose hydrolase-like predicted phosphorylase